MNFSKPLNTQTQAPRFHGAALVVKLALALSASVMGAYQAIAQSFTLVSPDVVAGQAIAQLFAFNGFGCTGQNISPGLTWSNPPAGTKSLQ